MQSDLDLYVSLCRTLGPCTDLVQGAGGNISVKSSGPNPTMYIKSSGTLMANTTNTNGWVRVAVNSPTTVIEGYGKPSMEAVFHTLPARIVVHLHPINHLNVLCAADFQVGFRDGILYIPYMTPGEDLGAVILTAASAAPTARIIYLQNHGVIYLADTEEEIYNLISQDAHVSGPSSDISTIHAIRKDISDKWGKDLLIKPCFALKAATPISTIKKYTPDMALFIHSYEEGLRQPSIWFHAGIIYTIAATLIDCYSIEELLIAYSAVDPSVTALTPGEISALFNSEKEKARLAAAGR